MLLTIVFYSITPIMATTEQTAVQEHPAGHAVVGAVAGAGKTTTMIGRVAHLLARGADPRRILVIMFNKSAQEEFADRLAQRLVGELPEMRLPEVLTFHAFGRRLTQALERQGWLAPAELITQEWRLMKLAKQALNEVNEERDANDQIEIENETLVEFLGVVSAIKAGLVEPGKPEHARFLAQMQDGFLKGADNFERLRRDAGWRGFDDLIYDPVCAMREDEAVAAWVANRYDHILIDEYQDINEAQQRMIRIVAGERAQVMAVGDEDQCIYTWRGSKPEYMTEKFEQDFPGATRYTLSRTFRSGHRIALMASQVVSHNAARTDKVCVAADTTPATEVDLAACRGGSGEALVERLNAWVAEGRRLSEAVILVREYSQSVPVETALTRAGIPYNLVGAQCFYNRPEILSLRGHLHLGCGGLGQVEDLDTRRQMIGAMLGLPSLYLRSEAKQALVEAMTAQPEAMPELLMEASESAGEYQQHRLYDTAIRWQRLARDSGQRPAADALDELIRETQFFHHLKRTHPRKEVALERRRMCEDLVTFARDARISTAEFLAQLLEMGDTHQADTDAVLITSGHRAKGLEWDYVLLPDLAEGRFPMTTNEDPAALEEERRLFYVMLTRARQRISLLVPGEDRALFRYLRSGGDGAMPEKPIASRFVYEANVTLSNDLGGALHTGARLRRHSSQQLPTTIEAYLRELDHPEARAKPGDFKVNKDETAPPFELEPDFLS